MVRDTGTGIKPEDRERVFEPLGKLEATAKINTSGVGLGLSTCKKIVEALNGSIHLDDEFTYVDDKGGKDYATSIAIVIPCAELTKNCPALQMSPHKLLMGMSDEESKFLNESDLSLILETVSQ